MGGDRSSMCGHRDREFGARYDLFGMQPVVGRAASELSAAEREKIIESFDVKVLLAARVTALEIGALFRLRVVHRTILAEDR